MSKPTNEIILVNARWSDDVSAYVAKVDGKTVIISIVDGAKTAPSKASTKAAADLEIKPAKTTKAKVAKAGKRVRAKSLTKEQEAAVVALINQGKTLKDGIAAVAGVTPNIYARLKRTISKKVTAKTKKAAPKKRAKATPAA